MKLLAYYKRKGEASCIVTCDIAIRVDHGIAFSDMRPFLIKGAKGYWVFTLDGKRIPFKTFTAARMALSLMVSRLT